MKYKTLRMVAIFFITSFNRDGGGMAPLPPPWIRSCYTNMVMAAVVWNSPIENPTSATPWIFVREVPLAKESSE